MNTPNAIQHVALRRVQFDYCSDLAWQIQMLEGIVNIACAIAPLANPCVDPRVQLVTPKGKAPTADALAFNGARVLSAREADVDQRGIVI